jgi:hypothetical protein
MKCTVMSDFCSWHVTTRSDHWDLVATGCKADMTEHAFVPDLSLPAQENKLCTEV